MSYCSQAWNNNPNLNFPPLFHPQIQLFLFTPPKKKYPICFVVTCRKKILCIRYQMYVAYLSQCVDPTHYERDTTYVWWIRYHLHHVMEGCLLIGQSAEAPPNFLGVYFSYFYPFCFSICIGTSLQVDIVPVQAYWNGVWWIEYKIPWSWEGGEYAAN